jgi:hypothetical protein
VQQQPINPYAPPTVPAPYGAQPHGGAPYGAPPGYQEPPCWRELDAACLWKQAAVLPPRCVKCNAPAQHRIKKTLYWHEPWVYLTILAGVLVYALVAMAIRKSAHVDWALCDLHNNRRKLGIGIAVGSVLLGILVVFAAFSMDAPGLLWISLLLVMVVPIVGLIVARNIAPSRIDDQRVWVKVGGPFLDSIPNAPPMQQYGSYPQRW